MTTTTTKKKINSKTNEKKESVIPQLPSNPFMFEILNLACKQRSNAKKVEVLKKYEELISKKITDDDKNFVIHEEFINKHH